MAEKRQISFQIYKKKFPSDWVNKTNFTLKGRQGGYICDKYTPYNCFFIFKNQKFIEIIKKGDFWFLNSQFSSLYHEHFSNWMFFLGPKNILLEDFLYYQATRWNCKSTMKILLIICSAVLATALGHRDQIYTDLANFCLNNGMVYLSLTSTDEQSLL